MSLLQRLVIMSILIATTGQITPAQKINVLLITGQNNHDWQFTSTYYEKMLEETGKFDVTITNEPAKALSDAKSLEAYDLFFMDYNGKRWGPVAEKNFIDAVSNGTGIAITHASNNPFSGWHDFERMVGYLWRQGTGHGRFHAFDVEVTDRNHPITVGMPRMKAHPDELYHKLLYMHDAPYRTIMSAFSAKETGGTGRNEPMVMVRTYGRGRVFHTPLGHVWRGNEPSRVAVRDKQLHLLLCRGLQWAARRPVTFSADDFGLTGPSSHKGRRHPGFAYQALMDNRLALIAELDEFMSVAYDAASCRLVRTWGSALDMTPTGPKVTGVPYYELPGDEEEWAVIEKKGSRETRHAATPMWHTPEIRQDSLTVKFSIDFGDRRITVAETPSHGTAGQPDLKRTFVVSGLGTDLALSMPLHRREGTTGRPIRVSADGRATLSGNGVRLTDGESSVAMWFDVAADSEDRTITRMSGHAPHSHGHGWTDLVTTDGAGGLRGYKKKAMPEKGWVVRDGELIHEKGRGGGDLVTRESYEDFEFECEWKVAPGGNSGIIYLVSEDQGATYNTGPEYQVLDDAGHRDGRSPKTAAGSLYALVACVRPVVRPAGQWNSTRIVKKGRAVEHWLNGVLVVSYELGSDRFNKLVAGSKFRRMPRFAKNAAGHIALQDHHDEVHYRGLRVRRL